MKQDSEIRQAVVHLSLSKSQSVNTGVSKDVYLGSIFISNYLTVDIRLAFHQLKVDPGYIDPTSLINRSHLGTHMAQFSLKK